MKQLCSLLLQYSVQNSVQYSVQYFVQYSVQYSLQYSVQYLKFLQKLHCVHCNEIVDI